MIEKSETVHYTVEIKEVATGKISLCPYEDEWQGVVFMWESGNYSCDCNREIFFRAGAGLTPLPEDDENKCGNSRYLVRITNKETKEIVHDEFVETV